MHFEILTQDYPCLGILPTRQQLRAAEFSGHRRREPCRARRQLDFSQDENDRIVPSFWDRED